MLPSFVIIVIFVVIFYYAFLSENTQFAATASAIRQIWSGGCRLSCRQSEQSGQSGLSGLSGLTDGTSPCQIGTTGRYDCVCDSCPCGLIENFLRTCRPATRMYTNACHTLSHYYYNFLRTVLDAYEYGARILECGTSCQRNAQVINNNEFNSSENFNFDKDRAPNASDKKSPKFIRSALDLTKCLSAKKSSISFKEPPRDNSSEGKGSGESIKDKKSLDGTKESVEMLKPSEETLRPTDDSSGSVPPGYCSKCVEKGKTCISDCPRAKK